MACSLCTCTSRSFWVNLLPTVNLNWYADSYADSYAAIQNPKPLALKTLVTYNNAMIPSIHELSKSKSPTINDSQSRQNITMQLRDQSMHKSISCNTISRNITKWNLTKCPCACIRVVRNVCIWMVVPGNCFRTWRTQLRHHGVDKSISCKTAIWQNARMHVFVVCAMCSYGW